MGTATKMTATAAVKPVHEKMRERGLTFDPNAYVPEVKAYYILPDRRIE